MSHKYNSNEDHNLGGYHGSQHEISNLQIRNGGDIVKNA